MATGSVNPFTPTNPTQVVNTGTTSVAINVPLCDAVLVVNSGAISVFVEMSAADMAAPVANVVGGMPILAGTKQLIGIAGGAYSSSPTTQLAFVTNTGSSVVYVTPGSGTQY